MKLVILSCLIAFVAGSDVVELTDADFSSEIGKYGTALVEFFAPWCGHCKRLAPEYEKAATALKDDSVEATLIKVDCIANTEVCGKYGVSGYPTLKIFRAGELSKDYDGPRESAGIVKYMKKQVEPASRLLETVEQLESFTSKSEAVVVGYFTSEEDDDAKIFSSATSALREDYTFGHTYSAEVAEKAGFSGAVVLHRPKRLANKFEDATLQMTDSVSQGNIKKFLKKNFHGLCGVLTPDNQGDFDKPLLTALYDVDYVKNPKGTNYYRNRVMKIGQNYRDDLTFSIANADDFSTLISDVGLEKNEQPVVIIRDKDDRKYPMQEKFSMPALETFIKSYLAGEIKPKIKSEPVPESQDGSVTVVVGDNFDEIVMDETKDVLVEFYAPWCGHCKKLAPIWDELGEKMKGNPDVVIAKVDATANDSPSQFQVSGFPTIYWAPKNDKKNPTKYSGGRELKDFVSFLEKNGVTAKSKTEL